jgi:hypothetical protein
MVIFHGYVSLPEGNHQKFVDLPYYWDDGDDEDDIFMLPIHWESLTWPDMAMERVLCRFETIGICRIHWFCGEVVSTKGHHWPFSFMSRIGGSKIGPADSMARPSVQRRSTIFQSNWLPIHDYILSGFPIHLEVDLASLCNCPDFIIFPASWVQCLTGGSSTIFLRFGGWCLMLVGCWWLFLAMFGYWNHQPQPLSHSRKNLTPAALPSAGMSQASAGRGIDMAEVSKHEGCPNLSCMDRPTWWAWQSSYICIYIIIYVWIYVNICIL